MLQAGTRGYSKGCFFYIGFSFREKHHPHLLSLIDVHTPFSDIPMIVPESVIVAQYLGYSFEQIQYFPEIESQHLSSYFIPKMLCEGITLIQNKNQVGFILIYSLGVAIKLETVIRVVQPAELIE